MKDNDLIDSYGLHNLLEGGRKAIVIWQMMGKLLQQIVEQLTYPLDVPLVESEVSEVMYLFYHNHYKLEVGKGSFRVLPHPTDAHNICILPLSLTALVLLHGRDIPPAGLPQYGGWEGENHVYIIEDRFSPQHYDGKVPFSAVQNKLIT